MATRIQYEIILYWSKEDQAFIAEVPELPGCAADGSSYHEAITNAELVRREWIGTARRTGRPGARAARSTDFHLTFPRESHRHHSSRRSFFGRIPRKEQRTTQITNL